jgi:uncharacterized membrane protein
MGPLNPAGAADRSAVPVALGVFFAGGTAFIAAALGGAAFVAAAVAVAAVVIVVVTHIYSFPPLSDSRLLFTFMDGICMRCAAPEKI